MAAGGNRGGLSGGPPARSRPHPFRFSHAAVQRAASAGIAEATRFEGAFRADFRNGRRGNRGVGDEARGRGLPIEGSAGAAGTLGRADSRSEPPPQSTLAGGAGTAEKRGTIPALFRTRIGGHGDYLADEKLDSGQ